jgi:hypothetical protein
MMNKQTKKALSCEIICSQKRKEKCCFACFRTRRLLLGLNFTPPLAVYLRPVFQDTVLISLLLPLASSCPPAARRAASLSTALLFAFVQEQESVLSSFNIICF